jgi:hypothetical protein
MARILPCFKNMCSGRGDDSLAILGKLPHITGKGVVVAMRSLRSFLFTLGGLTFVAVAALFTASLGIAIAGAATVLLFGQWLSAALTSRPQPRPIYARTRQQEERRMRIWNDGKGTIIDM